MLRPKPLPPGYDEPKPPSPHRWWRVVLYVVINLVIGGMILISIFAPDLSGWWSIELFLFAAIAGAYLFRKSEVGR